MLGVQLVKVAHVRDESGGVFAFDCEWTPTLSAFDQQFCAILTVATRTRGFLVDCVALRVTAEEAGPDGSPSVAALLDSMFGSPNLVSVGTYVGAQVLVLLLCLSQGVERGNASTVMGSFFL